MVEKYGSIKQFSDEELEAEVKRRADEKAKREIPKVNMEVTAAMLHPLADLCASYIEQLAEDEPYADEKLKDYIFEAAIELFYGKDVWKWVNPRLQ